MTTTASGRENGRSHKAKRRSVSNAASPDEELNGNLNGTEPSGTSSGGGGRGARRVRDDTEDIVEDKKLRGKQKATKAPEDSGMLVDGEGDGEEEGGDTRCVCGKSGDEDIDGLMVMCETCKVWQHTLCMDIPDDAVPEHYYCEICEPTQHVELLKKLAKVKRPRRSSVTRTMQKQMSSSPSPPAVTPKTMNKRRNTINSRAYEEQMAEAIEKSKIDAQDSQNEEEQGPPAPISRPSKKRRRSFATSVPGPESIPSGKRSQSASVTSEPPAPVEPTTPNAETLEVPEQAAPVPSDEEPLAPPQPATRVKRGGGPRKGARKNATPSIMDDNDIPDPPARATGRGRQPNQYSTGRRGGHGKRMAGHHGAQDINKRFGNNANKVNRPPSPPPFLTSWGLPDHLAHLQNSLPTEIPEPLDIRTGAGAEVIQERGVKVKWPTKRMTVGEMSKRVRNMLEYVAREQMQNEERQSRVAALDEAIASGKYKRLTPEPTDSMDVDAIPTAIDEDVKPTLDRDPSGISNSIPEPASSKASHLSSSEPAPDNVTAAWMKLPTDEMLSDILSGLLAFQDRYRPRSRRNAATVAAA